MAKQGKQVARHTSAAADEDARAQEIQYASGTGFLLRLFWMGIGNVLLLYVAGSIANVTSWSLTWRDPAFALTVAALVVARYVDVTRYDGLTINSEPASLAHVRRYTAVLLVLASIIWTAAQSVKV